MPPVPNVQSVVGSSLNVLACCVCIEDMDRVGSLLDKVQKSVVGRSTVPASLPDHGDWFNTQMDFPRGQCGKERAVRAKAQFRSRTVYLNPSEIVDLRFIARCFEIINMTLLQTRSIGISIPRFRHTYQRFL